MSLEAGNKAYEILEWKMKDRVYFFLINKLGFVTKSCKQILWLGYYNCFFS